MSRSAPLVLLLLALGSAAACGDDTSGAGGGGTGGEAGGSTTSATSSTGSTSSSTGGGGAGGEAAVIPTPPADAGEPWDLLSQWNLFVDGPAQVPADRVEPYDVIAPLFSDEAAKLRFVHVPEGSVIAYRDDDVWGFPVGTVLVKTFAYPEDARDEASPLQLVETRLLHRGDAGWKASTYVWNEDGTDAERKSAGDTLPIAWIDAEGAARELDYAVPNTNQCAQCHGVDDQVETLGGLTLQLDRERNGENQIDRLHALGFFDVEPTPADQRTHLVDPWGEADPILRGRSYLHANCASCHREGGDASTSGMWVDFPSSDPEENPLGVGICKNPTSPGGATCGNTFDIVPGEPDASILICRVSIDDPEDRMPPLGRQLIHDDGVAVLRDFIEALPPAACTPEGP